MADNRTPPRPPASLTGFAGVPIKVSLDRFIDHVDRLHPLVRRAIALTRAISAARALADGLTAGDEAIFFELLEETIEQADDAIVDHRAGFVDETVA